VRCGGSLRCSNWRCVRTEFVTHYYQGFDALLSVLTHPTHIFSKSNRIPITSQMLNLLRRYDINCNLMPNHQQQKRRGLARLLYKK
jgi:hypothetical protein